MSGGLAVSENLQLERDLPTTPSATEGRVPIESIPGITVREFDWQPLVQGAQPEKDPLAALVPSDQHALLCPSFQAMIDLMDHASQLGEHALLAADPRAEDAESRLRYQRQLCLPLGQLERLLGGQLISSVAMTGGDLYFRTGTDVAVLFQSPDAAALLQALKARALLARDEHAGAEPVEGQLQGVAYWGLRSPDRLICAYQAQLGQAVAVTNSTAQLDKLIRVHKGELASLAALPEYAYFRTRFARGEDDETAFLVLSDRTIRRWCGPRWRIATSRRTRAAAAMSEIQAARVEQLAAGRTDPVVVSAEPWLVDELGQLSWSARGPTRRDTERWSSKRPSANWTSRRQPIRSKSSTAAGARVTRATGATSSIPLPCASTPPGTRWRPRSWSCR